MYKIIALIVFFTFYAQAEPRVGEALFTQKCAQCHSDKSANNPAPILHGQEKVFLMDSLNNFKNGKRTDHLMGQMNIIAEALTENEIEEVSYYLAAQDICSMKESIDHKVPGWIDDFKEGRQLVESKNCMHCHGSFHHKAPRLYGQKKSYLINSLKAFKEDKRPAFPMMIKIAKSLTDEEVEKISHYLNGMQLMRECSH